MSFGLRALVLLLLSYPPLASCEPIRVTTTTGMIADLVSNIGGPDVSVQTLMGPGVDPHLYKATQGDLVRLQEAQLIFYNGLHLEGKMTEIFEKISKRKPTVAVSRSIAPEILRKPPEFQGNFDPHIWFDVALWQEAGKVVQEELIKFRPEAKAAFDLRATEYLAELETLHSWIKSEISNIPAAQRVLITAHDAFGYFGRAYQIEVMGLQGVSTATEYGLQDLKRITDLVIAREVKAIFVESSVPEKFVLSIQEGVKARGHQVKIGGTLFSDAMGSAGTPEGTYIGMVRHNVNLIVTALK